MKITKEVFDNWFEQTKKDDAICAEHIYSHMKNENPCIEKYMLQCKAVNPLFAAGFFAAYSLFMRQSEINELES